MFGPLSRAGPDGSSLSCPGPTVGGFDSGAVAGPAINCAPVEPNT